MSSSKINLFISKHFALESIILFYLERKLVGGKHLITSNNPVFITLHLHPDFIKTRASDKKVLKVTNCLCLCTGVKEAISLLVIGPVP